MKRIAAIIFENDKGEQVLYFTRNEISDIEFANILKNIVLDYIDCQENPD